MIVVLSNLDNQDYPAFWPTSPSTPIMWDAGYSQYTVTITSQDEFLPRWDITIIVFVTIIIITLIINKSIIQFVFHHHNDLKSYVFLPRTIKLRLESGTMSKEVFSAKFS